MTGIDVDPRVESVLEPLRAGLAADHVSLTPAQVRDGGKTLVLRLETSPESCADCFVGAEVMQDMILQSLVTQGVPYESVIVESVAVSGHE